MTPRLLVILLVYHPSYARAALTRLQRLVQAVDAGAPWLVVRNHPHWHTDLRLPMTVLAGDNRQREFSGWQRGLDEARTRGLLDGKSLVLFANDSFCVHNRFGPFTQRAFVRALRAALDSPRRDALVGEAYGLGQPYRLAGCQAERWVSTHLFGIGTALLQGLGSLCPPQALDGLFESSDDAGAPPRLSPLVSGNLAAHIEHWMAGTGRRHWPGHQPGRPLSAAQWRAKVGAILLEKSLAARAQQAGGRIVDVLDQPHARWWRRAEWLHWHGQRLSGRLPARVGFSAAGPHGAA